MFCHKCGNQSLEGAVFCQKCGAKLIADESVHQTPIELVATAKSEVVEHTPKEILTAHVLTSDPKPIEAVKVGNGRNEVTIYGYHKIGDFDRKIKVLRNGELVGKVGQGETITVPNDTDGTFLFKCSFSKAQYTVHTGSGELQLEWDLGKLKVFDLFSGEPLEKLELIRKNNKKWLMAGSILTGICAIVMLIAWFMSDGGTNHVELVRYYRPFESTTCEMVIDKYFTWSKWKERKANDDVWYVDVSGLIAIDGGRGIITLTFEVKPKGDKYLTDKFWIEPYSIDIDGESDNAERASSFIIELFDAYDKNYESLDDYYIMDTSADSNFKPNTEVAVIPSPNPQTKSTAQNAPESYTTSSNSSEVLYNGISLLKFLGESKEKWIETFGKPDWEHDWFLMYEDKFAPQFDLQKYPYKIYAIEALIPSMAEINGVTLDKTRAELINIFGQPSSEYFDEGYGDTWTTGYNVTYVTENYSFTVTSEELEGKPYAVGVHSNFDIYEEEDGGSELSFQRSDYFTGTTLENLLRNPDQFMYSNVLFSRWKVSEVIEPKLYFMVLESNSGWVVGMSGTSQYMIFDDRNNSGANALINDIITIYGKFNGNESITMSDGQGKQVPRIVADMMIMNNIVPDDTNSLTSAFIDSLNAWHDTYVNENQYISNQSVRIACKLGDDEVLAPYYDSLSSKGNSRAPFLVDGYWINKFTVKYNGVIIDKWSDTESLPTNILDGNLCWLNGTISMDNEYLLGYLRSVAITLNIDTIEQY